MSSVFPVIAIREGERTDPSVGDRVSCLSPTGKHRAFSQIPTPEIALHLQMGEKSVKLPVNWRMGILERQTLEQEERGCSKGGEALPLVSMTPLVFTQCLLGCCEVCALLSFGLLILEQRFSPQEPLPGSSRIRTLACWHFVVPLLLYGLRLVLSAFWIYILGLLLMMISLHILREWWIDPQERWNIWSKNTDIRKTGGLLRLLIEMQFSTACLILSIAVYNILLPSVSSPLLEIVSISGPLVWALLDFVLTNVFWQDREALLP
jgi:hypothetical protein